jgi:hypothetical protein
MDETFWYRASSLLATSGGTRISVVSLTWSTCTSCMDNTSEPWLHVVSWVGSYITLLLPSSDVPMALLHPIVGRIVCLNMTIFVGNATKYAAIHRTLFYIQFDRLRGLVVRVHGYRSGGPGSIPGTTRKKNSSGSGTGSTQPREYN